MCALKSPAMAVFGNMLSLCKFPKCQREGIRSVSAAPSLHPQAVLKYGPWICRVRLFS